MSRLGSYATPVACNNEKTQRVFKPCVAKIAKLLTAQPWPMGYAEIFARLRWLYCMCLQAEI